MDAGHYLKQPAVWILKNPCKIVEVIEFLRFVIVYFFWHDYWSIYTAGTQGVIKASHVFYMETVGAFDLAAADMCTWFKN